MGVDRLQGVIEAVVAGGPTELALADSIGVAVPTDVRERVGVARDVIGDRPITLRTHFHNSRNTGLANAADRGRGRRVGARLVTGRGRWLSLRARATGNIPTEDLVYLLHRMGYPTGIDLPALCDVAEWIETALGHPVPGFLAKAGIFPDSVTTARARPRSPEFPSIARRSRSPATRGSQRYLSPLVRVPRYPTKRVTAWPSTPSSPSSAPTTTSPTRSPTTTAIKDLHTEARPHRRLRRRRHRAT